MKTQIEHSAAKENRQHSSVQVPYSMYDCIIPDLFASVPMHWHEEMEFNYILSGEGNIYIDGEMFSVKQGDLIFIPPNTLHAAYSNQVNYLNYKAFVFHHTILGTRSKDRSSSDCIYPVIYGTLKLSNHFPNLPKEYPEMYPCVREILDCAEKDDPLSDLLLKSSLLRLFFLMEKEPVTIRQSVDRTTSGDVIRPALAYMEENYRKNITIEDLADCCNLSESYFMACFKKIAGTGAIEHLTQLRIMNVCEELLGTQTPISEIAYQNGFENLSNFNRQFKKMVGTTPNRYRSEKNQTSHS